jgi:acetylglutamate kinase
VAVGLSGDDAGLIVAVERDPSLGFVGDVASVQPAIVERLLAEDIVPVLSTVATDASGQAFNINADTVAGAVAGALGAAKAIFLTDVPGLLSDLDDRTSLVAEIGAPALQGLLDDGTLQGGMIPKAEACLHAVAAGAGSAHLLDGRVPHVVLLELLTDEGVGTMVTQPGAGS